MSFLSRFIKKNGNTQQPPGPSDREEPREVTRHGGLLHPEAPTGTRFNRKLIMILGSIAGLVAIFAFMSALQPPKKFTAQEQAEEKALKGEKNINFAPVPETISTAPETYAGVSKFKEDQQLKRGEIPMNKLPPAGQQPGNVGNIKDISPETVNAYNAQPPRNYSGGPGMMSDEQKQLLDARKSPIKFAVSNSVQPQTTQQIRPVVAGQPFPQMNLPVMPWQKEQDDQNMQLEKREFMEKEKKKDVKDFYVKGSLIPAISKYEVKAGSIIPGVMITGINSDLPGRLVGQVRENVYDTVSGQYLLIPQGTKVIGAYDSKVAYAQERVLIVWTRLIYPNGDSIDLEGMEGVDLSGYAGMKDKVNNHYAKLVTGVVLSSVLSAGAKVAAGNSDFGDASFGQQAVSGAAQQVNNAGAKFVDKNLNVQPTIEIRPGMKFNVFVNKDLILKGYKKT